MKILIAGDYVPRNRLAPLVEEGQYNALFGEVQDLINSVDYSLVNFESPIVENGDSPIPKCGPNLHCTAKAVDAIKYAGFKCATLANNHIRDYGDSAVKRTIELLSNNGLDHVGAGENLEEAAHVLYKQVNGEKLAIINCCENEFSIASNSHYGANPLNPVKQYYEIGNAKKNADYVIVIVHGGHEHYQLPSPRMQDTYRFFIDSGADLVVNHHQHCYSGFEFYKGTPIVYGIGNYCMDKEPIRIGQIWNYGYMVIWDTHSPNHLETIPYEQCGENPGVHLLSSDAFDNRLNELNNIIAHRELLIEETNKYYSSSSKTIISILEPIQNRYIAGLQHRHFLPSLITKRWLLKLQNYVICEAHRDKMDYFFKNR